MADLDSVEMRLTRLEDRIADKETVSNGLARLEATIRQANADLRSDHIGPLRDDLARVWVAIREQERLEYERVGGKRQWIAVTHFLSAGVGGIVAWLASWLASGRPPPPHFP
jgi:hypothetical protein